MGIPPTPPSAKGDIVVDLSGTQGGPEIATLGAEAYRLEGKAPPKELAAFWIGKAIVVIFGLALFLVIIASFTVVWKCGRKPDETKELIIGAVIPLLEKVATFFTTLFSPLLAFILGYYFGHENKAGSSKSP